MTDLAVWRAVTALPDIEHTTGRARTGPPHPVLAARAWQHRLDQRVTAALATAPGGPWRTTLQTWNPRVLDDPWYPVLASRLDLALIAGRDVPTLLTTARAQGPLPDDHPAAALWYRLARELGPVTSTATNTRLRPDWTPHLTRLLGDDIATRVLDDPAWPTLVAAVHAATSRTHTPAADLLDDAVALTGHVGDTGVPVDLAATVIAWRLSDLTTPADPPIGEHDIDDTPDDYDPADYTPDHQRQPLSPAPNTDRVEHESPADPDGPPPADPMAIGDQPPSPQPPVATQGTTLERVVELTAAAAAFYRTAYPRSPAAGYLRSRIGTDLTDTDHLPATWVIGYATPGWTTLTDHLRATMAATDTELLDAGLSRQARSNQLIDVFRDRLLFGLHNPDGTLVGFTGRAAPGADDHAPKYLNTPTTIAYRKSEVLFGLAETAHLTDATPALAEGPLDAIALTLAGNGHLAGVATCGTALTPAHAELLVPRATTDWMAGPRILVAPDNDTAGHAAAARAHALLTTVGLNDRWLRYAGDVKDAAEAYAAGTLHGDLNASAPSLAELVLRHYVSANEDGLRHGWPEARARLYRAAAETLTDLPTRADWNTLIHTTARLALPALDTVDELDRCAEEHALRTGLYRCALARAVELRDQALPHTAMSNLVSDLAELQTELDLAPGAEITASDRGAALHQIVADMENGDLGAFRVLAPCLSARTTDPHRLPRRLQQE